MRGRASGFYFGVIGLFLTGAGPVVAYFGALYAFDHGMVPAGQTNLAMALAVFAGVVLCIPGLTLMWMADVVNELTAVRAELFEQARAHQKTAIALDNVSTAIEDAFLADGPGQRAPRTPSRPTYPEADDRDDALSVYPQDDRGGEDRYANGRDRYHDDDRRAARDDDPRWRDDDDDFERI